MRAPRTTDVDRRRVHSVSFRRGTFHGPGQTAACNVFGERREIVDNPSTEPIPPDHFDCSVVRERHVSSSDGR